ncbi:hypothetical protein GZ77_23165 [Endozoicomonas montiporae]|uniref:Uncharacterized protein n=2 Tax=Endozoicomonas montiporae TaxID=1027273 RepID=A0A081N0M2_9GAMM|nr:hypothetical protein EZMO1_0198 [Endozoicomonas montiporae CL-33]KEQ11995.1 hypothetical protein GZ77_23165 [Endozoicomonas montiporae]
MSSLCNIAKRQGLENIEQFFNTFRPDAKSNSLKRIIQSGEWRLFRKNLMTNYNANQKLLDLFAPDLNTSKEADTLINK